MDVLMEIFMLSRRTILFIVLLFTANNIDYNITIICSNKICIDKNKEVLFNNTFFIS